MSSCDLIGDNFGRGKSLQTNHLEAELQKTCQEKFQDSQRTPRASNHQGSKFRERNFVNCRQLRFHTYLTRTNFSSTTAYIINGTKSKSKFSHCGLLTATLTPQHFYRSAW